MQMEMVPEGFYRAVVSPVVGEDGSAPVQFGESKDGKPQVLINFEIIDGPYAQRVLPWWGSFNASLPQGSKAKQTPMQRTLYSLRLCGWVGDDVMDVVNQDMGNEVSIQVEHHEYDGKVNARVSWVNKPGGGGVVMANPMTKDALRRFSASVKSVAKSIPPVPGKKAERAAAPGSGASSSNGGGWSGNDDPDPPKSNEFDQSHPAGGDIPF
jgi:hypothetical protein